jgi:hypothetical protein
MFYKYCKFFWTKNDIKKIQKLLYIFKFFCSLSSKKLIVISTPKHGINICPGTIFFYLFIIKIKNIKLKKDYYLRKIRWKITYNIFWNN